MINIINFGYELIIFKEINNFDIHKSYLQNNKIVLSILL